MREPLLLLCVLLFNLSIAGGYKCAALFTNVLFSHKLNTKIYYMQAFPACLKPCCKPGVAVAAQ